MAKIEKSLELNITHEILTLADTFWWSLYNVGLWRYWSGKRIPFGQIRPQPFATGIPISLEGNTIDGGYDVKLDWHGPGGPHRAAFLQFKAGEHRNYCRNSKSVFYRGKKDTQHVMFRFNNNTQKNQHSILRNLAKKNSGDAVLYVFPRVTSEDELKKHIGKLFQRTTFISVKDLDKKANKNGVTIIDGTEHKFRACYDNYKRNEVNKFYYFYEEPDLAGDFIAELISVRVMKAILQLKNEIDVPYEIIQDMMLDSFARLIITLLQYFGLRFALENNGIQDRISSRRLKEILSDLELPDGLSNEEEQLMVGRERAIFYKILDQLNPYFKLCDDSFKEIPEAKASFSIPIDEEGVSIHFSDEYGLDDFSSISYMVF